MHVSKDLTDWQESVFQIFMILLNTHWADCMILIQLRIISFTRKTQSIYVILDMTRVGNSALSNKRTAYYHCTRCCKEASPNCLRHKQQIEIFLGSEIEKLAVWKQYQCNQCTKIGYTSEDRIICWFCSSSNVKLLWILFLLFCFISKLFVLKSIIPVCFHFFDLNHLICNKICHDSWVKTDWIGFSNWCQLDGAISQSHIESESTGQSKIDLKVSIGYLLWVQLYQVRIQFVSGMI